jgi:dTDP-4-dehydrorhamnose reductase
LRILLTGKNGQLGAELAERLAPLGEVTALGRAELDFLDPRSIQREVRAARPEVIVNAAAYTKVDKAESERASAFAVNAEAAGVLAEEAKKLGALLVHFSTDYVFDGEKPTPYLESDRPAPVNVYGESKLVGELAIEDSGCRYLMFRTSWVYAAQGRNFVQAILAGAKEKPELRVVDDQRGAPTPAHAIAGAVAQALVDPARAREQSGLYHLSMAGETTWYGFAKEILAARGMSVALAPIRSAELGAGARRPRNSLLDNARVRRAFGIALPDWREGLAAVLAGIH